MDELKIQIERSKINLAGYTKEYSEALNRAASEYQLSYIQASKNYWQGRLDGESLALKLIEIELASRQ